MSTLPAATQPTPRCGACGDDTWHDGAFADAWMCDDCGLAFDTDTLAARFSDDLDSVCGHPCVNGWHHPGRIQPGVTFECNACQLPAGHRSFHWTGCVGTRADGVVLR